MANKGETGTIEISAYESSTINILARGKIGIKVYRLLDMGLVDLYMKLISFGVHHKQKVSQSYTHYWDHSKPMYHRNVYHYYIYYNTKWAKKYV